MQPTNSLNAPVNYHSKIADIVTRMIELQQIINDHLSDTQLRHLAVLRASQINRCGFCVKMHSEEARNDGETSERLDHLVVWQQVDDFSDAEKAMLAWVEALTHIKPETDYGILRARLRQYYSDQEIAAYTAATGMINFWNRMQISEH